ncbi:MAG TPA: aminotransferase class I/II-fold pyridoxal phosphate-dependent enzyme [Candidatus Baltobacteraceae bacterium]|jgi:cystathionine beta-lyase|nr:aminotransferase class I/II-fold pyridoxal phosphate-dependent enzyme [Candidatus Baltobacteraceae bacterium]
MVTNEFERIDLENLRKRTSEKWITYPPDILPAFVAEMDFPLAPAIRRCLIDATERSDCGYAGLVDLAPAFCDFALRKFGWTIDEKFVIGLPDVMAGVTEALEALTQPGAGVVINPPVYPPFFEVIRAAQREVVEVPLMRDAGGVYGLDLDGLERAFAAGAQAYLLCSPHNPVGAVWPREKLAQAAALARRYNVLVIADEIHAPLTMPGVAYVPFLSVAEEGSRCIALLSASKAWNIPGLKCALAVAGSDAVLKTMIGHLNVSPSNVRFRIGQFGALASAAAFRDESGWLDDLREYLDSNRRLLKDLLRDRFPAARYHMPQATYLAWIDCADLGIGNDPARVFLKRGRVALERGYKFGSQGSSYVRLNFGTSRTILREIVDRMSAAMRD